MGRRLSRHGEVVRKLFRINQTHSICTVCEQVIPGFHTGNLVRHLERKHPQIVANEQVLQDASVKSIKIEYVDSEIESVADIIDNSVPVAVYPGAGVKRKAAVETSIPMKQPPTIVSPDPSVNTYVQRPLMPLEDLMEHYYNMIVLDGLPLHFTEGLGSSPLFKALNENCGLRHTNLSTLIQKEILERAHKEREQLRENLLATKGFSLILKYDEDYYGTCVVLVQFYSQQRMHTRILGTFLDSVNSSTARSRFAMELLNFLSIPFKLVYSILDTEAEKTFQAQESPFYVPCLAKLFLAAIQKAVQSTIASNYIDTGSSLNHMIDEIERLLREGQTFLGSESKSTECLIIWLKKASKVHEQIVSLGEGHLATDAVAAVFKFWIQANKQKEEIPLVFAKNIHELFCNKCVLYEPIRAAMFLDPRIQQLLSPNRNLSSI